jgi:hypothetical protein
MLGAPTADVGAEHFAPEIVVKKSPTVYITKTLRPDSTCTVRIIAILFRGNNTKLKIRLSKSSLFEVRILVVFI